MSIPVPELPYSHWPIIPSFSSKATGKRGEKRAVGNNVRKSVASGRLGETEGKKEKIRRGILQAACSNSNELIVFLSLCSTSLMSQYGDLKAEIAQKTKCQACPQNMQESTHQTFSELERSIGSLLLGHF